MAGRETGCGIWLGLVLCGGDGEGEIGLVWLEGSAVLVSCGLPVFVHAGMRASMGIAGGVVWH